MIEKENKRKKRIMISIDIDTLQILSNLKGYGSTVADKVSRIVTSYLSEKSYLKDYNKEK